MEIVELKLIEFLLFVIVSSVGSVFLGLLLFNIIDFVIYLINKFIRKIRQK